MGATLAPPEARVNRLAPTGGDFQADQIGEARRHVVTAEKRPGLGRCLGRGDAKGVIDRQPDQHVVDGLAGGDAASINVVERIGLGIQKFGFNVPQPIVALKPAAGDLAGMKQPAAGGA